jgi:DNA-binding IclR family transcriptional regulator
VCTRRGAISSAATVDTVTPPRALTRLASELDQSCHLTVYVQGKQVVLSKGDSPSGMGFAVRAGAELDVC